MSRRILTLLLTAAFIVSPAMFAADTEAAKYILVLHDTNDRAPDVAALGGRVLQSSAERQLVMLTPAAVEKLQSDPRVAYLQRLWDGRETQSPQTLRSQTAPARVVVTSSETPAWQTGIYSYDRSGQIKGVGADTYAYDSAARLIRATVSNQAEAYQYDWFGNLRMLNAAAIAPETNRVSDATYDGFGNLIADGRGAYRYDATAMMSGHTPQASSTTPPVPRRMIYTADDERIAVVRTPGGTIPQTTSITVRDFGGKVLREFEKNDVGTEWRRDYVYAGNQVVAGERQVPNGEVGYRHFHLDHLGSVRLITRGGDGARISDPKYFPFGNEAESSTDEYMAFKYSPLEPMKFTGHERDYYGAVNVPNDDHLDYMHARYYSATAGRFLSVDPSREFDPGSPQSWNRYSYAINSSMTYFDPDGRKNKIYILQSLAYDVSLHDWKWQPYLNAASNGYRVSPVMHASASDYSKYLQRADSTDFVFTYSHAAASGITDAKFWSYDKNRTFDVNPVPTADLAAAVNADASKPAAIALIGCNTQKPAQQLANMTGVPVVGSVGLIQFRHDKLAMKMLIEYASKNKVIDQAAIDAVNKAICSTPTGCPNYRYTLNQPANKP